MQTPIYVELFKIKDFKKFDRIVMININSVELWIYYGQSIKVSAFEKRSINDTGYKSSINLGDTYIINWEAFNNDSKVPQEVKDGILKGFKKNLMDLRKKSENERILVIANPPYSIGNEVTKKVIEILQPNEYINLMPASKYREKELYKYIKTINIVPENVFEDATTYPVICTLLNEKDKTINWHNTIIKAFDPTLRKFYEKNSSNKAPWLEIMQSCSLKDSTKDELFKKIEKLNNKKDFMFTRRVIGDGPHKTARCHDYRWNILKWDVNNYKNASDKEIPISYCKENKKNKKSWYQTSVGFIRFSKEIEFNNFCDYWYRGNLSNKIIKGLKRNVDTLDPYAIPRIDWNRPWTDEEILEEYGFTEDEIKDILA